MKEKKRRLEQFMFYDYIGIEHHLNKMAEKGWKLHKISSFYWEYSKIEPQNLTYAVTYFSEASEFNPYPTENQRTFHDYCKNAGWDLIAEWAQMQIFCTNEEDTMPIETEESVKLRAIHKSMKKNFIPSSIILLLIAVAQLFLQFQSITRDPVSELSNSSTLYLMVTFIILFIQYLIMLTGYASWYLKSKKAVEIGESCIEYKASYRPIILILTFLMLITVCLSMFSLSYKLFGWVSLWAVANIGLLIPLINLVKKSLKRAGVTRRINLFITMFCCIFLSFALIFIMSLGVINGLNAGWFGNKPDTTYTTTLPNGYSHTWDIYHHKLPLKVEDIQNIAYDHYSYKWTQNKSILLSYAIGEQQSFPDGQNAPEIYYEIVKVKIPLLFDICLQEYLHKYDYDYPVPEIEKRYFKKINAPEWKANEVYQLFVQEKGEGEYILCQNNHIIYINFYTVPTTAQISIAVEKLSK